MTALNVTDTAILLLNGQYGPEVGTQNHFRYTEKLGKPVIFLVNQLDSEKCDFDQVLEQLKENYGSKVIPVQYPLSTGPNFNSLIDVLLMKKIFVGTRWWRTYYRRYSCGRNGKSSGVAQDTSRSRCRTR